jgi:hypothetical protein
MFHIKEWNENLDLTEFYLTCVEKGYINNSSEKRLVGSNQKEKEWNCWILYSDQTAIGSVAAHSFDDVMGPNTYRILTRTCSFREYAPTTGLTTTKRLIKEHQNFTDQFFLPKCLEWAKNQKVFATSNTSNVASQRLVNNYYFPILEELGLAAKVDKVFYRGLNQNVWEIFKEPFLNHLSKYPRW